MGHTGSLILWQRPGRVWLPVEQSSVTAGVQTLCLGLHIWTSLQLLLQVPIMTARRTPAICNLSKTDWGALTGYRRKQIQEWLLRQCVCRFWGKCRRPWATPVVCIKLMKINLGSCSKWASWYHCFQWWEAAQCGRSGISDNRALRSEKSIFDFWSWHHQLCDPEQFTL